MSSARWLKAYFRQNSYELASWQSRRADQLSQPLRDGFQLDIAGETAAILDFVDNEVERLTFARILRDSVYEFLITSLMLFGVTSIVRWVIGSSPIPRRVQQI